MSSTISRRTALSAAAVLAAGTAVAPALAPGAFAAPADTASLATRRRGRVLYVRADAAPGGDGRSPRRAFNVLQKAADATRPGDLVLLLNGTYTDAADPGKPILAPTVSGTAERPIRFAAHPGHRPVLTPSKKVFDTVLLAGVAYIELVGLTLTGTSASLRYEDAFATQDGMNPTYNANGINIRNDDAGAHSHHITIRGCSVDHFPGGGIAASNADYVTVDRNVVHSNAWFSVYANSGITTLAPYNHDKSTGYRNVFTNNVTYDNESFIPWQQTKAISDGNGIIIDSTTDLFKKTGEQYVGRTLVANNISFANGGSGIHSFDAEFVDIVNNTVYNNSRSPALRYAGLYARDSNECNLLNNISYLRSGEPTNTATDNTASVRYDYNVYFNGTQPEVFGPHDIIADPRLVNPSDTGRPLDFRIRRGSPARDSGTSRLAPRFDFLGVRRPQGRRVDRGAFELR